MKTYFDDSLRPRKSKCQCWMFTSSKSINIFKMWTVQFQNSCHRAIIIWYLVRSLLQSYVWIYIKICFVLLHLHQNMRTGRKNMYLLLRCPEFVVFSTRSIQYYYSVLYRGKITEIQSCAPQLSIVCTSIGGQIVKYLQTLTTDNFQLILMTLYAQENQNVNVECSHHQISKYSSHNMIRSLSQRYMNISHVKNVFCITTPTSKHAYR